MVEGRKAEKKYGRQFMKEPIMHKVNLSIYLYSSLG